MIIFLLLRNINQRSLRTTRVRTPGPKRERERSEHMWWQVCHIS